MEYVLDLGSVDKNAIPIVGGKNANLGEMLRTGIRVPPGFAVTTRSYLDFLEHANIKDQIFKILAQVDPDRVETIDRASSQILDLIQAATIPDPIKGAIEEAYQRLCQRVGLDDVPVAVRSSATAEDLPTASFAGQQDTYLWIQGRKDVVEKVRRCWASLFGPRAIAYRIKNRFPHEKVHISIGVQKMVNAKAAGVMFTLNPLNGDLSKVVIEGSWGLGETVVSGTVNPDKFVVDKVMMELNERVISRKHIQCIFDPASAEAREMEVPEGLQGVPCLEDKEILELVQLARRIEAHYKMPMDIEWSIDKEIPFPDNVFIVQARPETVWSQKRKESKIGKKSGYELLVEQAMKRIRIAQ
jgi:pyruvate,water dikinase